MRSTVSREGAGCGAWATAWLRKSSEKSNKLTAAEKGATDLSIFIFMIAVYHGKNAEFVSIRGRRRIKRGKSGENGLVTYCVVVFLTQKVRKGHDGRDAGSNRQGQAIPVFE